MPPLGWLALVVASGVGAWAVGWPALQAYRQRDARDTNTERYLAWRGRAAGGRSMREGMTREERTRIIAGAVLAVVAVVGLVAFFLTS